MIFSSSSILLPQQAIDIRFKPRRWPMEPYLTQAPWAWERTWAAWAHWEGSGNRIYDVYGGRAHATITNFSSSFWDYTKHGLGYKTTVTGADEDINVDTGYTSPFTGTQPVSYIYFGQLGTIGGGEFLLAQGILQLLQIGSSTTVQFILNAFSSNDRATTTATFSIGDFVYVTGTYDEQNNLLQCHVTVNFATTTTASVTPTGSYTTDGSVFQLAGNALDHTPIFQQVHGRYTSLEEHTRRAKDPFALLRPALPPYSVAAPAVGNQGAAMYHHLQNLGMYG